MSGKKKIRQIDALDLLSGPESGPSIHAIDAQLFGAIQQGDANRQSANPVSIFEISPDPAQPRRVVPYKVREVLAWNGDTSRMAELFSMWEELVNDERVRQGLDHFYLAAYLDQNEITSGDDNLATPADRPESIGPLERVLVDLVELATSIYAEGLTNPITVVKHAPSQYRIETGERRWLAYHLLYLHTTDVTYSKIAARTVDELNIWRQAAENNARANLNAISKARQFAVLLMDLLADSDESEFLPFDHFSHERMYYAQVADGESFRIPRNSSERLLNATGLKSAKQLREYRALLRLPREVWEIADDMNWTERAIRDLTSHAMNDDDLVQLASRKARQEGYSVPMGTVSQKSPRKPTSDIISEKEMPAPGDKRYYAYLMKLIRRAKSGRHEEAVEQAYDMIAEFRRWLDEQEDQLR